MYYASQMVKVVERTKKKVFNLYVVIDNAFKKEYLKKSRIHNVRFHKSFEISFLDIQITT